MKRFDHSVQRTSQGEAVSGFYEWYVVCLLMLCQVLASVDARLPYIMIEELKHDLQLSDTQIGLIAGPAFSLTYAVLAIPIARLSDRKNRSAIISSAIFIWSGFTMAAAFARGFGWFAVTRIGVAFGESALTPAAHSIIAGYLPRNQRAKGIAVYSFGIAVGAFLAFAGGGYIGDRFGWRVAFLVVGSVGVLLAALVGITLREPDRGSISPKRSSIRGSVKGVLGHSVVRNVILGGTLLGFSSGAINSWGPAYVMRTFGLSATEVGASFGAVMGLVAMIGILAGGFIGSWLAERHPRYALQMLSGIFVISMVTQMGALVVNSYSLFLVLLAVTILLSGFYIGPTFAAIQSIVDPSEHSFGSAVTLFCINGIGIAASAFVVGLLSDAFLNYGMANPLRWALVTVSGVKLWSAWYYYCASRTIESQGGEATPNSVGTQTKG